jgi:hypothetical protein
MDGIPVEANQFGEAQAGLNREQQQGIVAAAAPGGAIGRAKLKLHGVEDCAALMASLRLPDPKMMDVAVPANMRQGLHQEEVARRGWAYSTDEAKGSSRPSTPATDRSRVARSSAAWSRSRRASSAICRR